MPYGAEGGEELKNRVPSCSTSFPAPYLMAGKAADGPSTWAIAPEWGDLGKVAGFWL